MRISALSYPTFAVRLENKELRNHQNGNQKKGKHMRTQTTQQKINVINIAIHDRVAIVLEDYYSQNSNTRSDRTVLPLKIKGDCVLCLDIDKNGEWRQFKFDRINGNVYEA